MGKKKRKIIKYFVSVFCILIIGVLFCISPLFNIRNIRISGNNHYDDNRIIEIIGIRPHDNWFKKVSRSTRLSLKNIFMYRYFEGENSIKKVCPYIEDVKIRLCGIGEYAVDIKEREGVAKVAYLAEYVIIDQSGVALDIVEDTKNSAMPKINGVILKNVRLGEKIGMKEDKIEAFCKIYDIINRSDANSKEKFYKNQIKREVYNDKTKEQLYHYIDYMDFGNLGDIKFFLDGRILVYLGDVDSINDHKVNYLKEVFFNNLDGNDEGVLNFRGKKNPTFSKKVYAKLTNEEVEEKVC